MVLTFFELLIDLIALSQKPAALELLLGVIFSKKIKNTLMVQLEPIMLKFVDLCVELRKGKFVKEGLHQFKNVAQQANAPSVEVRFNVLFSTLPRRSYLYRAQKVITYLLDISEKKIDHARTEAEAKNLEKSEGPQDGDDAPELLLLNSVSLMSDTNRIDQSIVAPWLKFMWDTYRTALDTLRSNNRFKALYQTVATRAFKFCIEYNRKSEFGRLCDLLRQHVSHANKGTRQSHHVINLKDVDTFQRYLEVRFFQLDSAIKLQLWQEAFRSVEDINGLILMCKDAPKSSIMANFYRNLANILLVAQNYLFHTEVLIRYYNIMLADDSFSCEEQCRYASKMLISALASVPHAKSALRNNALNKFEDETPRTRRLQSLFQIPQYPSREHLLNEIISMGLIEQAGSEAKKLFNMLEVSKKPLFLVTDIKETLEDIVKSNPENEVYIAPLCQIITIRLVQHLSRMYSVVSIDNMLAMTSFIELCLKSGDDTLKPHEIEKYVVDACNRAGINIYIDHMDKCINLNVDIFVQKKTSSASYSLQFPDSYADKAFDKIFTISKQLEEVNVLMESVLGVDTGLHIVSDVVESLKSSIPSFDEIKDEFAMIKQNQELIAKRKEQRASEIMREEREELLKKEAGYAAGAAAAAQTTPRVVYQSAAQTAPRPGVAPAQIPASYPSTFAPQVPRVQLPSIEESEAKKRALQSLYGTPIVPDVEFKNKLKAMFRRADHLERAYRLEELPYLEQDYKDQLIRDDKYRKEAREAHLNHFKLIHESNMAIKKRLLEIVPFYSEFKRSILEEVQKSRAIDEKKYSEYVSKVKEEKIKAYKEQELKIAAAKRERLEEERLMELKRIEEEKIKEQKRIEEEKIKEQKRIEEKERMEREEIAREEALKELAATREHRSPPPQSVQYRHHDSYPRSSPPRPHIYTSQPSQTATTFRSSPDMQQDNYRRRQDSQIGDNTAPRTQPQPYGRRDPDMNIGHSQTPTSPRDFGGTAAQASGSRFSRDDQRPQSFSRSYYDSTTQKYAGRRPAPGYPYFNKPADGHANQQDKHPYVNGRSATRADDAPSWRRFNTENNKTK